MNLSITCNNGSKVKRKAGYNKPDAASIPKSIPGVDAML